MCHFLITKVKAFCGFPIFKRVKCGMITRVVSRGTSPLPLPGWIQRGVGGSIPPTSGALWKEEERRREKKKKMGAEGRRRR
ncbi:hypothetical protein PVAP13_5KG348207 [Panicum virgatum]|uniref:Uncharacterized protein n=1 Tax=Panicum virgatum TaxID=38727 RepID=A0A8T0SM63_PANVG|nr:hypothetical protein PVAP13_5KG348207 [Panicum virgatum]